jgi:NAD(P)-dependent dehydrogenase (short-subunit alcohol dehydrogenase family)
MVTGGASGMGLAMAVAFASEGANVSVGSLLAGGAKAEGEVVHMPGQEQMDHAVSLIEAEGVEALGSNLDVTSDDSVEGFYQATVDRFGQVDILANAAGITAEKTIVGHPDALWDKVIDVNLTGTYRAIKRVLPGMIERGWGRIINIASTAASVGAVTSGAYCASKAGVVGLTRCVALEGAPHGVTCNAISPTWVDTSFGREWMSDIAEKQERRSGDEYISDVERTNPQGRLISPTEIGALALFLCSDAAHGITMEDLRVSAGSLW